MPEFFVDSYFHIGSSHLKTGKPCQDYALTELLDNNALAIISDGCTGGGKTDIGSRVVTLSTATVIKKQWEKRREIVNKNISLELGLSQKLLLTNTRHLLGLQTSDMLATCIYAYLSPSGGLIHVQGDGVVAIMYKDGSIGMSKFEWKNNMPYYPAYDESMLSDFIREHGDDLGAMRLTEDIWTRSVEGEFAEQEIKKYTLGEGVCGVTLDISEESLNDNIAFIAIFSDGVTQINGVDWKEAVVKLLSFKNTTGEFAKRRMIREIHNLQKEGKEPFDDISYSVIGVNKIE